MIPEVGMIDRLGFEAWADNLIVNALEDMAGEPVVSLDAENGDVTLVLRIQDGQATATVRAYVEGKGWLYHDRVIPMKGGRP